MMRSCALRVAALVLLLNVATALLDETVCGKPTDPCMNEANWNQCESMRKEGCQSFAVLESCPLQFVCESKGPAVKEEDTKSYQDKKYCVKLNVFHDQKCSGEPVDQLTLSIAYDAPGSPCYHDASMYVGPLPYSVKNQYCKARTGEFIQDVYFGIKSCKPRWYNRWISGKQHQIFDIDSCANGFQLAEPCHAGPCEGKQSETQISSEG